MTNPKLPERGKNCPRCGSTETVQMTNYGRPILGRYECRFKFCGRSWDELSADAPDYVPPNTVAPKSKLLHQNEIFACGGKMVEDDGVDVIIDGAIAHGELEKDVALEGSDLADVLKVAWKILTPPQRADLLAQDETRQVLSWLLKKTETK